MAQGDIEVNNKERADDRATGELLKESLKIVDKLSKIDVDDISINEDEKDKLDELIEKAKKLTKSRLWNLK